MDAIGALVKEFLQEPTTKDGKKQRDAKPIKTIKEEKVRMLLVKIEEFSTSYRVQLESDLQIVTAFLKAIFVPCLHLICELPVENLWRTIIIVLNFVKALDEKNSEDVYFRLAHAKTPLSYKIGFPIKESVKNKMKESAPKSSPDGIWLLKTLSNDRESSPAPNRERDICFYRLLESFKKRDLIKLNADDFQWLIPHLWPQRITKITGGMPNSESYIGSQFLDPCEFSKALNDNVKSMSITWSNGFIEKFNEKKIRSFCESKDGLKTKPFYTWILVEALKENFTNDLESPDECQDSKIMYISKLMSIIASQEIVKGIPNNLFPLNMTFLLNFCYIENPDLANFVFNKMCSKKESNEISEDLFTAESVQNLKLTLEEILTESFMNQLKTASPCDVHKIMIRLASKAKNGSCHQLFWQKLLWYGKTVEDEFESNIWLETMDIMKDLVMLSLGEECYGWLDVYLFVISKTKEREEKSNLVEKCLKIIMESKDVLESINVTKILETINNLSILIPFSVTFVLFKLLSRTVDEPRHIDSLLHVIFQIHKSLLTTDLVCELKNDHTTIKVLLSTFLENLRKKCLKGFCLN